MRSATLLFFCGNLVLISPLTWAQTSRQPDNLVPLPEIPESLSAEEENSFPPELGLDPSLEPEITIHEGKDKTMIEEYRINGELYVIKITPRIGKPYYLLNRRSGAGTPHRGDMESGVSAPMWQIYRF